MESGPYLLAVDVGNTHTVLGLFKNDDLVGKWRIRTIHDVTSDELAALLNQLCFTSRIATEDIQDVVISCVVPPLLRSWETFARVLTRRSALAVRGDISVGMPIHYKHPHEIGADRLVNAVAAYSRLQDAVIVVDCGTATTFDCISADGEYLGGTIAPGLLLSAESLSRGTSALPRVDLFSGPGEALAKDTASAMRAGIIYGFAGLTDGIVHRLFKEYSRRPGVVATGGLASLIAPHCSTIEETFPDLTLEGLAIIYKRLRACP